MAVNQTKPILGILIGDSTGVGPEIVAKLAVRDAYTEYCRPIIIGDARIFQAGLHTFGGSVSYYSIEKVEDADWEKGFPILDTKDQDPSRIVMGKPDPYAGAAGIAGFKLCCKLCKEGKLEGFIFGPYHKAAMKEAGCEFESEHHLIAHEFGDTGPFGEVNMLDDLITVRTTSHVPIKDVSAALTEESIMRSIEMAYNVASSMGIGNPRLGVAALNPHCGENGLCGREEIDLIIPTIEKAKARGWDVQGPVSSDILFIRAFKKEYDAVVTMYHDQGQIAVKLMGFGRSITFSGGHPYPVATCGHGTAYGRAGQGRADENSMLNAVKATAKMAMAKRNK